MRLRGPLGALVAVGLAAAVGAVLLVQQHRREREARVLALLAEADRVLEVATPDRSELSRVLAKLRKQGDVATADARLLRARARILAALGRERQALEELSGFLDRPDAVPEDLLLAARLHERRFAHTGELDEALAAMEFAERHFAATGSPASLFLAWQCAVRSGQIRDADRLAVQLFEETKGSRFARLVAALRAFDPAKPGTLAELARLAGEFDSPPAELELALGMAEIQTEEGLDRGLRRIEDVLARVPAYLEARNAAAVAYHRAGDRKRRDEQLRWLLANAPSDDARRPRWRLLLESEPEKR